MCAQLGNVSAPLQALVALLPLRNSLLDMTVPFENFIDKDGLLKVALPLLREESGGCPVCILAAIRQAQIPVPVVTDFDFAKEMKSIFDDINEERAQSRSYSYDYS